MGLHTSNSAKTIYLQIRENELKTEAGGSYKVVGFTEGEGLPTYQKLTGTITGMYYRDDEFNGKKLRKLVTIVEDDRRYSFSISVKSPMYYSYINFLSNADVSRELTLNVVENEIKNSDAKRRTILVEQDGTFSKAYFTKEDRKGLPEWELKKINGENVYDRTKYLEYLEHHVLNNIVPLLSSSEETPKPDTEISAKEDSSKKDFPWLSDSDEESDFPF